MGKYNELIKRLRDAAKISEALAVLLPHSEGNATAKLYKEAADAIEAMNYELKSLYNLLGTHPDPRGENGEAGVECMVLSKTDKTTQEQPSHSPSLGYYYAFEFDETTGETYMPKEET